MSHKVWSTDTFLRAQNEKGRKSGTMKKLLIIAAIGLAGVGSFLASDHQKTQVAFVMPHPPYQVAFVMPHPPCEVAFVMPHPPGVVLS